MTNEKHEGARYRINAAFGAKISSAGSKSRSSEGKGGGLKALRIRNL